MKPFTLDHFREWASRLVLDSGEPWNLEEFQSRFVEDVFSGVPECWLVVPEGNGKTTLLAGIALYHVMHTEAARVPVAASSREQAENLYQQAEGFVLRSNLMGFKCQEGYRRIRYDAMSSRIQVFAADDRTGDGVIPTLCLLDELHRHRDLKLYRTWRGKLVKRGGQIIAISTAGEPATEFETTREAIRQSGDVERTETFVRAASERIVLHEWAVPEDGDPEDLELVAKANPFSGVTVEDLRNKRASPTWELAHWRRFVCNLPTRAVIAAVTEQEWHDAKVSEEVPPGEVVDVGLDVAWKWDTTALVPLWTGPGYRLLGDPHILVPPRDGSTLHPDELKNAFFELQERNPIGDVVMDMKGAEDIASWLEDELGLNVIDRAQGNVSHVADYAAFMEGLRNGTLRHTGHPVLRQHVLNATARRLPGGDYRFDRPNASRGAEQDRRVIDALTAAAMVVEHSNRKQPPRKSVYETRSLATV